MNELKKQQADLEGKQFCTMCATQAAGLLLLNCFTGVVCSQ